MAAMLGARLINPECLTNQLKFTKSFLGDFIMKFNHTIDRWEIRSSEKPVNYTMDCGQTRTWVLIFSLLFPFLFLVVTTFLPLPLCVLESTFRLLAFYFCPLNLYDSLSLVWLSG